MTRAPAVYSSAAGEASLKSGVPQSFGGQTARNGQNEAPAKKVTGDSYRIRSICDDEGEFVFGATNAANNLQLSFLRHEVKLRLRSAGPAQWWLGMRLMGMGREDHLYSLDLAPIAPRIVVEGRRIEYRHQLDRAGSINDGGIVEWYVNDPRGLEQGFTIQVRPTRHEDSSYLVHLDVGFSGNLNPEISDGRNSMRFVTTTGATGRASAH